MFQLPRTSRAVADLLMLALVAFVCVALAGPSVADASSPGTIAVQGRLHASGVSAPDGSYLVTFKLYKDPVGGAAAWSEVADKLNVAKGRFRHALGSAKPIAAALASGALWLGVQVANEPEMKRTRIHAAPFVARSATASGLNCTGCLKIGGLKVDGDLQLGKYAIKAKQVVAGGVTAQQVQAQSFAGDGSKLVGAAPAPAACGKNQVMRGVDGDGNPLCTPAGQVGGGSLEQVSGGALTTKAGGPIASGNTPKPISDNNPVGTVDQLTVPDLGTALALNVSVHLTNSDLSSLELMLYDPNNAVYMLHKGKPGKELNETWPTTAKPVSGDLGTWLGKNPKGKWRLRIIDKGFLNNGNDGVLKSWSVNVLVKSNNQITATGPVAAAAGLGLQRSAGAPYACNADTLGAQYWDSKDAGMYYCDGSWRRLLPEPLCGNGVINGGEQCDDGNAKSGDGCTAGCQKNVCGDGVLWPGVEQCDDGNTKDGDGCDPKCKGGLLSCRHWFDLAGAKKTGPYLIDPDGPGPGKPFQVFCDMTTNGGGWTLIARFANKDATNWMHDSGEWWYTRTAAVGTPLSRSENADMYSPAFHSVKGKEMRLSRTSNPTDIGLLVTKNNCLADKTFRAKITGYGNFQNGGVWGNNSVKGTCDFTLGSNWSSTNGFKYATCAGNIGGANKIGFWSDWSSGDGAVMMIGGGGNNCARADHGIGVTEANAASFKFNASGEDDFGTNGTNHNDGYALNLWVR